MAYIKIKHETFHLILHMKNLSTQFIGCKMKFKFCNNRLYHSKLGTTGTDIQNILLNGIVSISLQSLYREKALCYKIILSPPFGSHA